MQPTMDLKKLSGDLETMSNKVLQLLEQAAREAKQADDQQVKRSRLEWASTAIQNIAEDRNKLHAALLAKDPSALRYAAGELSVLPRYLNDYNYSWFSGDNELQQTIDAIHKTAASIIVSMNIFDPASMEQARKALS